MGNLTKTITRNNEELQKTAKEPQKNYKRPAKELQKNRKRLQITQNYLFFIWTDFKHYEPLF